MVGVKQQQQGDLRAINKWRIIYRLGEGSFGSVYAVTDKKIDKVDSKTELYALKLEERQKNRFNEVLRMEIWVLKSLQQLKDTTGVQRFFCTIMDQGQTPQHTYVVMTMLGRPLDELRRMQPKRRFSLTSTLKIGIQLMSAFSKLHQAGFIHRDVKPANIAPGYRRQDMIYLFDFGLARFIYTDDTRKKLRPRRKRTAFRGTFRYCSINAQEEGDQGRVDDLWSVLYSLVELCAGKLPWAGVRPPLSINLKKNFNNDQKLFEGCPPSFQKIRDRLSKLHFEDAPNYIEYALLLYDDLNAKRLQLNEPFEWQKTAQPANMAAPNEPRHDDELAQREDGESETLRTADSIFSSGLDAAVVSHNDQTIDDTLDDLPENLMEKLKKEHKKRQQGAVGTPADKNSPAEQNRVRLHTMQQRMPVTIQQRMPATMQQRIPATMQQQVPAHPQIDPRYKTLQQQIRGAAKVGPGGGVKRK